MLSNLNRRLLKQGLLFFLYGAIANLGIGILVMRHPGDSSILSHSIALWIVALPAGVVFGVWMAALLRRAASDAGGKGWGLLAWAGLRGILSTTFALILLSIFEAVALVGRQHSNSNWPGGLSFFLVLMETATYGLGRLMACIPFGFAYGAIGGVYLRSVARRSGSWNYALVPRGVPRKGPLVWSAVGLLFIMVPIIGTACSTVGLVQGALDLRARNTESQGTRALPLTAVVIGSLGLLWFLLSVFVYVMAGRGWFRAS
jgi:hypothetical protein